VADGRWARIGSTNLNIASWVSNYELDVAIEDEPFAEQMAAQYESDLQHSTEIVLTRRNRVRRAPTANAELEQGMRRTARHARSGSAGRAAAGAFSVGSALGAALTDRRILGPAEAGLLFLMATVGVVIGIIGALFPRVLAWPVAFIAMWSGIAWAVKGVALRRRRKTGPTIEQLDDAMAGEGSASADPPAEANTARSEPPQEGARDRVASR
jgi:cardiolipin synthase